jgi:hypothetical protein
VVKSSEGPFPWSSLLSYMYQGTKYGRSHKYSCTRALNTAGPISIQYGEADLARASGDG